VHDTIAAISTAFGQAAIAVIRLSGPRALSLADSIFRGKKPVAEMRPRLQQFGSVFDEDRRIDDVLLSVHRAPHSYMAKTSCEISSHGGVLVTRRILESLLARGARAANPGEFTQRAYLNGKMDLTQAEAVMDLIAAQTDLALRAATEQLEGRLGAQIRAISDQLLELLAHVEASIDFPDEDVDPDTTEALLTKLQAVDGELRVLLATAARGQILREGVRTVITGAPNVGKSSLLNLFLGSERAIVSGRPGTTRDIIEEVINLQGIPLRLIDTAGLHESSDELDREGNGPDTA
jgi:tRNA modification GTPase